MLERPASRRRVLGAGLAGLGAVMSGGARAFGAESAGLNPAPPDPHDPRWRLWRGVEVDRPQWRKARISGKMPPGLAGRFFRAGPLGLERFNTRAAHLFDGDGVLQEYEITPHGVRHRYRFVDTPKRRAETSAGRRLYPGMFGGRGGGGAVRRADDVNLANTSVVWHGGKLLALWEAGSAVEIEPESLEAQGFAVWDPALTGVPFCAHPHYAADGALWTFGAQLPGNKILIYEIRSGGAPGRMGLLTIPNLGLVHDFAVTARHAVFVIPPLEMDGGAFRDGAGFLGAHRWRPGRETRIAIAALDDLHSSPQAAPVRWAALPAGFVFHLGAAWEDSSGRIGFDACWYPSADILFNALRRRVNGRCGYRPERARLAHIEIPPRGAAEIHFLTEDAAEFPRFVEPHLMRAGAEAARRPPPLAHLTMRMDEDCLAVHDGFSLWDETRTRRRRAAAESGLALDEFIPVEAAGQSWIIGTAVHAAERRSGLLIYAADSIEDGPVAEAWLDGEILSPALHGAFIEGLR